MHKYLLQSFCDKVGKRRVSDLKVLHVTEWVNGQDWNESTGCSARSTLLACLNWGVDQGYIESHPLTRLKRGSHKRRERVLTVEEREAIKAGVKPDFRDFLFGLEQTGARPFSELATLTAAMVDWDSNTVTLKEHKTAGKGKSRTIYLTPGLVEMLRRLEKQYPTGLLFRNSRGKIWTSHDATRRLHYITDKLGLEKATLYAYRHTFLTDALSKGMSADVLAELAGNSAITIARNYSHLSKKRDAMLAAAQNAVN
jgi:integrase